MTVSGAVLAAAAAAFAGGAVLAWWLASWRARAAAALEAAAAESDCARRVAAAEAERVRLATLLDQAHQAAEARAREHDARLADVQARAGALEADHKATVADLLAAREALAGLTAEAAKDRDGYAERLAILQEAEHRLGNSFAALSERALETSTGRLLELAATRFEALKSEAGGELALRHEQIAGVVAPMKDAIGKIERTLAEVEKARDQDRGRLLSELGAVTAAHEELKGETQRLVRALRVPHVRGRWGELQLQRVVELAGMEEHCDFAVQQTVSGDDGALRPDLVITLPGGRSVVVDAKAPVTAYLDAINTDDDEAREARMRDHAAQVRAHIALLGGKGYWARFASTPDFVVLFLPGESFFSAAVQYDPTLFEYGVRQRVFLAGPFTLLALLRTVAHGWSREKLAENARIISELGRDLYERLAKMTDHFDELRRRLQGAVEAHNQAIGSLEGRVLPAARRFRELGIQVSREISPLAPVESTARRIQAGDLTPPPSGSAVDGEVIGWSPDVELEPSVDE